MPSMSISAATRSPGLMLSVTSPSRQHRRHRIGFRLREVRHRWRRIGLAGRRGRLAYEAAIVGGYDQLIAASGPDDAAVVYYCGHGYHAAVPEEGRSWQCIAPIDLREGTVADWRAPCGAKARPGADES